MFGNYLYLVNLIIYLIIYISYLIGKLKNDQNYLHKKFNFLTIYTIQYI